MNVISLISLAFGTCYCLSYRISVSEEVTIYSNGTSEWTVKYGNYLDWDNKPTLVFASLIFLVATENLFLVYLIIINILLYIELRKIMNKKRKMVITK